MTSSTSKNILIVDDNPRLLRGLKFTLENNGFEVLPANNFFEAVQILGQNRLDLVLSDINMPYKNGFDLLEHVRKNQLQANIPFIFLTAFQDAQLLERARAMGSEELIYKPIKTRVLISVIHSRLNRAKELKSLYTTSTLLSTIEVMANAIESRDTYTGGHVRRVRKYSENLARVLGWPIAKVQDAKLAAILHDIGKIIIPDSILNKTDPLNNEEWRMVKNHTVEGEKLIAPLAIDNGNLTAITEGVRYHHEKYDGSGYPDGLAGEKIPPIARLLAIADAYDAMTSDRPYRKGMSPNKALQIIENDKGKHFDPDMATAFIKSVLSQQKGDNNE